MTSAISGRIIFKQANRAYLNANIRNNSLVFDLDNNILLYSPSGTTYYEFYPGPHTSGSSPISGTVVWSNIQNIPVASNSTSGVLSTSDYNKFNSKADVSAIPSTSGFALSTSFSNYYPISSTVNISGLTSPAQTQINSLSAIVNQLILTSGSSGISAVTWSIIQNVPIVSNSTSGVLTSSDFNKFNSKADVSAIPSTSGFVTSAFVESYVQSHTISSVNWNIIQNVPIVSNSTSGILTSSDFNKFNSKADVSAIPSTSGFVTSAFVESYVQSHTISSVNWNIIQNIPVASNSTSGVLTSSDFNKFNSKADVSAIPSTSGFVTSAFVESYVQSHTISSVNWNIIQNVPIVSNSTSGILTSSDFNKFNSKADVSAIPSTSGFFSTSGGNVYGNISANNISANKFYGDISLTNISNIINQTLMLISATSSTPSATISDIKQFSYNITPSVLSFVVSGGVSGNYTATYNIYTTLDNISLYKIAYGVLTSANNIDSNSIINLYGYNKFAADVSLSGTSNSSITVYAKS